MPPSGPRALQSQPPNHSYGHPHAQSHVSTPIPNHPQTPVRPQQQESEAGPSTTVNPYAPRPGGQTPSAAAAAANRLSWSDRKPSFGTGGLSNPIDEDVKPKLEPGDIKPNEAEMAEMRAKEEEARIMAELPQLTIPFGGAQWEADVSVFFTSSCCELRG